MIDIVHQGENWFDEEQNILVETNLAIQEKYKGLKVVHGRRKDKGHTNIIKQNAISFLGKSAKEPVVLGKVIQGLLKELCSAYQSHIHPTPAGPSGPPVNAGVVAGISARWKNFSSPQNKTL